MGKYQHAPGWVHPESTELVITSSTHTEVSALTVSARPLVAPIVTFYKGTPFFASTIFLTQITNHRKGC